VFFLHNCVLCKGILPQTNKRLLMSCKNLLSKIVLPILLLISQLSFAQDKTVTGKVTDSKDGLPVARASVQIKGSTVGTTTGEDGSFKITVPSEATVLVITNVGYEKREIAVSGKTDLSVSLVSLATGLTEIVVTGYGTQKKKEITSAITSISAEQFNKGNINDVAQLLQGKVAGLSIARPGGNVNSGFEIRLRGISTIGANTQPLVVVDGQVGADLNSIDPNDIKSIDILKDGSSAAIYGTRGSAGVIIVTTKTGSRGQSQLNYSGSVSVETAARLTKHMSAAEFRSFIQPSGIGADTVAKGNDYGANTDWYKEVTRPGISHQHNLSLSGGNDHTTYNASVNFRNAEGIAINTGFQQVNGRLNLTHKALNDKLVFNIGMAATRKKSDLGFDQGFEYAAIYNPTSPVYAKTPSQDLAGGGYFEVSATEYSNPVAVLKQNTNKSELKRLNLTGSAEYEIIKGLKFLLRYALQNTSTYVTAFTPSTAFIDRGFYNGVTGVGRHGYAYKRDDEAVTQLYENTLSYQKMVSRMNINAVAGYSYQDFTYQGYQLGAGNFVTDLAGENITRAQDIQDGKATAGSYKNGNKLVAFFGRVNLNWDNFVYLSASLRREGSTQFGPNNKWGNFPAVSAGIDLKRFVDVPAINTLKLRGSYGVTGALPPNPGLSEFTFDGQGNYYINGQWILTYGPNQNPNPDLKWEKKAETDIGLDFALLNSRLTGTIDYYNRKTKDLIFNVTVPSPPALFNTAWKNVGDLTGKGYEIAINYDVFKQKKLTWTTGINYSHNHIVLSRLDESAGSYIGASNLGSPGQEATQITRTYAGAEIGSFYQAVYKGVDGNGKFLFDDGTGKAVLSGATTYKTVIGHGLPKFEMGWTNTFTYGKLDLNFFLRGSFGHDLINTMRAFYENPSVASIYNVVNTKYFNPNLKDAQIFSSLYVEKGDFVKLDNATLGYNFVIKKGNKNGIRNLRAYITGRNLFTITNYTGADPEVRYSDYIGSLVGTTSNILAPGIDRRSTWVLTRAFTLGVNIGL
jgi:TonB-dependent starch-binding outer membrane protein SusC